ncbi:MAG: MFS transporter [Mangrovibacterium sp.]
MKEFKTYRENPMYGYLILLVIASAIGLQGWRTVFNNYAVDVVGVNSIQIGISQSVREIPGFLTFLAVYVMMIIAEHKFAALSVVVLGLGVLLTGVFPSFCGLLFTIIIMSTGFHFLETCNQSLSLQYFKNDRVPLVLAKMKSITALANIGVGILIWALSKYLELHSIFYVIGGIVIMLGLYAFTRNPIDKSMPTQKKKLVFKKKYWLFYMLNLLSGARRQIFVVFSIFILVDKYKFPVEYITALFIVNNIATYFISPLVGKAINRFGERTMLSIEYGSLIVIFACYAIFDNGMVAAILYIINNFFFSFSIGINSYFRKHADAEDIAPSMAVGFTINHIAAIVLPVVGGILWTISWRIPFIGGSGLALVSLIFAQFVEREPDSLKQIKTVN